MRRAAIGCFTLLALAGCRQSDPRDGDAGIVLSKVMGEDVGAGFERAREARELHFPEDHGPHPGFRTEWWYFTGNVSGTEGRQFGYQVTIFRFGVTPGAETRSSAWATNQIYMGHAALTDVEAGEHYFEERFARGAAGLAGAQGAPVRVWIEDWEIRQTSARVLHKVPELRITAEVPGGSIDLALEAAKPLVLQGDRGLSRKGPESGNASFYYSSTRMKTRGSITTGGVRHAVTGTSWMDREWSTSALGPGVAGWDWFALQLSDSADIMYYQLRRDDGAPDAFSKGTVIAPDGTADPLALSDVTLRVTERWSSPAGVSYPSGWRFQVPSRGIDLRITPKVKEQLMDVSVKYWEGAVAIEGMRGGRSVRGNGYVELAGYSRAR